jgi:hypothetical protein
VVPSYQYRCGACATEWLADYSIGQAPRITQHDCGGIAKLLIGQGVNISAKGFAVKGTHVRHADSIEDRWAVDLPAYKRMRMNGMQPPQTEGAAALEDTVADQFDIDHRRLYEQGISRDRINEINQETDQIAAEHGIDWTPGQKVV